MSGCAVVFAGVILYKLVFHLEKEEKAEQALRDKDVSGKLMHESGDEFEDDDGDSGFVPMRAVELVDRTLGKTSKKLYNKMTQEEIVSIGNDHEDELDYVMPQVKLV